MVPTLTLLLLLLLLLCGGCFSSIVLLSGAPCSSVCSMLSVSGCSAAPPAAETAKGHVRNNLDFCLIACC